MTLLPGVIPEIPESRAGIVPARLARKVGPLFGVRWDLSPYGLTWVSDYTKLTLSEIARGAPAPSRSDAAAVEASIEPGQWRVANRAVMTHRPAGSQKPEPLPNEIANATLNRYGPDTKAAVVLTAANALLAPVTSAVRTALSFLEEQTSVGQLPARMRVAAWAALVLEVFRSQPALFAAAVQAREVQRAALHGWEIPAMVDRACARVEVGQSDARKPSAGSPSSPVDLDAVDSTVAAVRLGAATANDHLRRIQTEELHGELTRRWLSRLVGLGTVPGEGLLWLADRHGGHRAVEVFAPHDPTLWSFLVEIAPLLPADTEQCLQPTGPGTATLTARMPSIPRSTDLQSLDVLSRRAVVLALTTLVRLAFNSGSPDPTADLHTHATLDALSDLMRATLPDTDPVAAVTVCRVADMRLELVRQDATHDVELGPVVDELIAALAHCSDLVEAGTLNASDAAELIRSGGVELMVLLRRHSADQPVPGVLAPGELMSKLKQLWKSMLELMQVDLDRLHHQSPLIQQLVGYQLHDYATFLGGSGSESDARDAIALYRDYVVPARQHYYERAGYFQPLLYSYQNATRATTRLADSAAASGDLRAARAYAEQGRVWISMALREPYTVEMLAGAAVEATDEVCRFALLAAPALLAAVDYASSDSDAADLIDCEHLLDQARRFADMFAKQGGHYARAGELIALNHKLDEVRQRDRIPKG